MSDIVARLRDVAGFIQKEHGRVASAACLATEAADEINSLREWGTKIALNALELTEVLREIAKYEIEEGCPCNACRHSAIARAALEGNDD